MIDCAEADVRIELGDVLYLRCKHCVPPKPKFFVVAQVQPLRMFLINSEINQFAASKPRMVALMPMLMHVEHASFLAHDSYLCCDHLSHEYSIERVKEILRADPGVRRGQISEAGRRALAGTLRGNHLVPRKYLRDLMAVWADWM